MIIKKQVLFVCNILSRDFPNHGKDESKIFRNPAQLHQTFLNFNLVLRKPVSCMDTGHGKTKISAKWCLGLGTLVSIYCNSRKDSPLRRKKAKKYSTFSVRLHLILQKKLESEQPYSGYINPKCNRSFLISKAYSSDSLRAAVVFA
jgi:hypothetical protein